jgi:hypothetical protein
MHRGGTDPLLKYTCVKLRAANWKIMGCGFLYLPPGTNLCGNIPTVSSRRDREQQARRVCKQKKRVPMHACTVLLANRKLLDFGSLYLDKYLYVKYLALVLCRWATKSKITISTAILHFCMCNFVRVIFQNRVIVTKVWRIKKCRDLKSHIGGNSRFTHRHEFRP